MPRFCIALALAAMIALPCAAQTEAPGNTGQTSVSSAGMGRLGSEVQAGNRDCLPKGAPARKVSVPSAPGAISCAPVGAGPATGYAPETPPKLGPPGEVPGIAKSGTTPAMRQ